MSDLRETPNTTALVIAMVLGAVVLALGCWAVWWVVSTLLAGLG